MTAPAVNRQARLSIPGVAELPARVAAVDEVFTDLTLLAPLRAAQRDVEHAQAFLDFMTDEGVWRTIGTIHVTEDGHQTLRFEPRGRVQLLQRRAYVRTDCIAAVVMTPRREGGRPQRCLTLNVSGGGLLVRGLAAQVGDELGFELLLDLLPARIPGVCKVVRVTPEGLVGVQFAEISDDDRDKLVHFAYTRERATQAQRRRG